MIIRNGPDDGRFEALYRKYYARTYRFFLNHGIKDGEAHDLAQETFAKILEKFEQYRGEAEWAFIETSARNQMLNWVRARKSAKRDAEVRNIDDIAPAEQPRSDDGPDLAERQQSEVRWARVRAAIAELPDGQRQAIELWLTDMKYETMARVLGVSVDAVKSRLRDAKRALRAKLGEPLPEDEE